MATSDHQITAKVICDSLNGHGNRLTTFVVTYPRIIMAEVNTHRMLCLAGNSVLSFDLPSGEGDNQFKHYGITIAEFARKWFEGSKKHKSPNSIFNDNLHLVEESKLYYPEELCKIMGLKNPTNLNTLARKKAVFAFKEPITKRWLIDGKSFIDYRKLKEERVHSLKSRLAEMKIRQINEITGDIQHAKVKNVFISGVKKVYTLRAGMYSVNASEDHLIFTNNGWKSIKEIQVGIDYVYCKSRKKEIKKDPKVLQKIDGAYRSGWNEKNKHKIISLQNYICSECKETISEKDCDLHHIIPVYQAPWLAFDINNIIALHSECHKKQHKKQGWQEGNKTIATKIIVDEISLKGEEQTYDLEIDGEFPNFFANDIVVHNSKSSASSRAIPIVKQIEKIKSSPFIPSWVGKAQSGMQAKEELDNEDQLKFKQEWLYMADQACNTARFFDQIKLHKQIANRILEPWGYVASILTATDWANFFHLRCHKDAQPEFMALAFKMLEAYVLSKPVRTDTHIPFGDQMEHGLSLEQKSLVACARCARVSYENHEGTRDYIKDLEFADSLIKAGHMSPFEHVAKAFIHNIYVGNFKGWYQHRKLITTENRVKIDYEKLLLTKPDWI